MKYDYVIVGAGPAGATCAYLLKKKKKSVLLIDKHEFPRKKVCGGVILLKTSRIIKNIFGKSFFDKLKKHEVKTFSIKVKDKYIKKISLPKGIFTINRDEFDNDILNEYLNLGGEFINGSVVRVDVNNKVVYLSNDDAYDYNILVGADGSDSKIRKYLEPDYESLGVCVGSEIEEENVIENDNITMYLNNKDFGYTFKIPNSNFLYNTVTCFKMKKTDLIYVKNEHNKHFYHKHDNFNNASLAISGVVYNASDEDSIALIGDAAGLVDPINGKGIYYALKSAKILSNSKNVFEYEMKLKNIILESDKKMIIQKRLSNGIFRRFIIFMLKWNFKFLNKHIIIKYLFS